MRWLIVVRHGEHRWDGHLNDNGRMQIHGLAEKLRLFVDGSSVFILTSPADRAYSSAVILGAAFSAGIAVHEVLLSGESYLEDFPGVLELVRSNKDKADVLVLVTHCEYVEGFPSYFAEKELGVELHSRAIGKGQAWVLDCLQRTLVHAA